MEYEILPEASRQLVSFGTPFVEEGDRNEWLGYESPFPLGLSCRRGLPLKIKIGAVRARDALSLKYKNQAKQGLPQAYDSYAVIVPGRDGQYMVVKKFFGSSIDKALIRRPYAKGDGLPDVPGVQILFLKLL